MVPKQGKDSKNTNYSSFSTGMEWMGQACAFRRLGGRERLETGQTGLFLCGAPGPIPAATGRVVSGPRETGGGS